MKSDVKSFSKEKYLLAPNSSVNNLYRANSTTMCNYEENFSNLQLSVSDEKLFENHALKLT